VRVALLAAFPFVTTVTHVYVLIFLINAATAFFTPAFEASLPEVVGPERYTRAVSLSRIAVDLEAAGGPLVAGVLIAAVGVQWAFWFDGLTYIASALLVLASRVPSAPRPERPLGRRDFMPELTHGTKVLLREPALRQALVLHMAEALAGAVVIVTTVVYVRDVLRLGDFSFALAMTAVGVGSSITAFVIGRSGDRARADQAGSGHLRFHRWAQRSLLLGGAGLALSLLPGAVMPGLAVLALLWALNGAGQALIAIPSVGLLADHTEPEERGRAYAAHFALTHLFWLATYPLAGYAAQWIGVPMTFTAAGIGCALLTGLALLMRGPHREHPARTV
jgi:MFS transporter, NRE family, putaive nickel resistance protein